jgi:hypothetical protein
LDWLVPGLVPVLVHALEGGCQSEYFVPRHVPDHLCHGYHEERQNHDPAVAVDIVDFAAAVQQAAVRRDCVADLLVLLSLGRLERQGDQIGALGGRQGQSQQLDG